MLKNRAGRQVGVQVREQVSRDRKVKGGLLFFCFVLFWFCFGGGGKCKCAHCTTDLSFASSCPTVLCLVVHAWIAVRFGSPSIAVQALNQSQTYSFAVRLFRMRLNVLVYSISLLLHVSDT